MDTIIQVINSVGFPIACAVALGMYAWKTTDKLISLTEKVTDALTSNADKMQELAEAIEKLIKRED